MVEKNHRFFCNFVSMSQHPYEFMVQIDKQKCKAIGYINKTYGIKGEVHAIIDEEFTELLGSIKYLFVDLEGGLVPFFISEDGLRFRNNDNIIVKFDFINSTVRAKELIGCKLYLFINKSSEPLNPGKYNGMTGVEVVDQVNGNLGKISRIDDYSGNMVLTVSHNDKEILIPLSDKIIQRFDSKNQKLYLKCPEGLIDIYLG